MPKFELPYAPLRINHAEFTQEIRRMYVKDPDQCSPEELESNILEVPGHIAGKLVMPDGQEIQLIIENFETQVIFHREVVGPE